MKGKPLSRVSARGQTVIPAEIRKKAGVKAGAGLYWVFEDGFIKAVTLPDDPVFGAFGLLKGSSIRTADLLEERRREREAEERAYDEYVRRLQAKSDSREPLGRDQSEGA